MHFCGPHSAPSGLWEVTRACLRIVSLSSPAATPSRPSSHLVTPAESAPTSQRPVDARARRRPCCCAPGRIPRFARKSLHFSFSGGPWPGISACAGPSLLQVHGHRAGVKFFAAAATMTCFPMSDARPQLARFYPWMLAPDSGASFTVS